MKLLYCIVVLGLIQYGLTAVPVKPFRQQQRLLQCYEQLMNKLDKKQFEAFKELFKKLLRDKTISCGSTTTFQNFKKNMKLFLKKYPRAPYKDLKNIIIDTFNIIATNKNNKDVEYILKAMFKAGFQKMYKNYTKSYVSVVKEKFIPKFEKYKKQLTSQELKQQQALMVWFKNLKNCSNYDCYSKYFEEFPLILNFNHL
ncbi:hypothetical protein DOY81_000512 [Sarcophaga bullata]|nr:hypothetical protein DOY81_000512 [Sarcophaga bullata]